MSDTLESPGALVDVPDAEKLCELLAAEDGPDAALIDPADGEPFYVGLDDDGALARIERG